jgi:hypothetical protein
MTRPGRSDPGAVSDLLRLALGDAHALARELDVPDGPVNEWRALTSHQMPTARMRPPTVSGA